MPTVIIPPPYQGPTRGLARVEVEGSTLAACLESLEKRFPGFRPQVVSEAGQVHRFVKLFVNGDLVAGSDLGHALSERDEIEILAAVAGG